MNTLDKDDLYNRTHWFSKDCKELVGQLTKYGLAIVDVDEANKNDGSEKST